jgi:alanine dehydrogenase
MLIVNAAEVEAVLDRGRLVDALALAHAELSAGRASMPPRVAATVDERDGLLAAMPSYVPALKALATKLVTVFPGNVTVPSHQAIIGVFDPTDGRPIALLDGTSITAARTAAGSALASRYLARADSRVAAVIGTGVQARSHVLAFAAEGGIERFVIAGRDPARARALADDLAGEIEAEVAAAPSIEEAVARADIVCATTHASSPVVRRSWLAAGVHVSSVGYNTAGEGEVDADTVHDAYLVVESRPTALAPPPAGAVELRRRTSVDAELGELVAGTAPGRTSPDQLTLYKSVGVAVQDAAAAVLVLDAARAAGVGRAVEL